MISLEMQHSLYAHPAHASKVMCFVLWINY
jgi:hypothetical protein